MHFETMDLVALETLLPPYQVRPHFTLYVTNMPLAKAHGPED